MIDSRQLLDDYVRNGSEAAFRELVARYIDLVYSTAVRILEGDTHRAKDVAQVVFMDLARQAPKFTGQTMLGGWLHRATCFVAANVMRGERRRQIREQQVTEMNALNEVDTKLGQMAPLLDEAINELAERDRSAILLRFYERMDLRSVGEALGTSENAAQKRVSRALDELRGLLKRRGLSLSAAMLGTALASEAVSAAPVGLAAAIASTALAAGAAGTGTLAAITAATKAITMTAIQKVLVTAVASFALGMGVYEAHRASRLQDQLANDQEQQASLAGQMQQLRQERDEAATRLAGIAKAAAPQPDQSLSEILKLRGEIARLHAQLASERHQTGSTDHSPGSYIAKDQITFAGFATPEAALESLCWANLNGTYDDVLACLTPQAQAGALNDSSRREQHETVKAAAAQLYKGLQITAKKILSDDKVELKFKNDHEPTATQALGVQHLLKYGVQTLVKVGNEWKVEGLPRSFEESWEQDGQIERFAR